MENKKKPLGIKNYGHIPHLPGSRKGPGDHSCHKGQADIATLRTRDKHDEIIVQEKLDGSNVGVARIGNEIYPITRSGYLANTSPHYMHHVFWQWAHANKNRFMATLEDGERLCGEWLMMAHGTRYELQHEPFVVFDIMRKADRYPYDHFVAQALKGDFVIPHLLHRGSPLGIEAAMNALNVYGFHGAIDPVEGAVWRVQRNEQVNRFVKNGERAPFVDFLVKYVRPDKVDGKYLDQSIRNEYSDRYKTSAKCLIA